MDTHALLAQMQSKISDVDFLEEASHSLILKNLYADGATLEQMGTTVMVTTLMRAIRRILRLQACRQIS